MNNSIHSRPTDRPLGLVQPIWMVILAVWLACGAGTVHAAACVDIAQQPTGGIGGTGYQAPTGGIGGTGQLVVRDNGIGGTGSPVPTVAQSTGVVGTITGFASICVNGLEIHYDSKTPVTINGRPASLQQMAVGQLVLVDAEPMAHGLQTRQISILNSVEGPVLSAVELLRPEQYVQVMGQTIKITAQTRGSAMYQPLAAGQTVLVSGHRNAAGVVIASRIDHSAPLAQQSVIGTLTKKAGRTRVAQLKVDLEVNAPLDQQVLLTGDWDGQKLSVKQIHPEPTTRFTTLVKQVVLESIVQHVQPNGEFKIGRFNVRSDVNTQVLGGQLRANQQVRVSGRVDAADQVIAERVEIDRMSHLEFSTRDSQRKLGHTRRNHHTEAQHKAALHAQQADQRQLARAENLRSVQIEPPRKNERPERIERPEQSERPERPEKMQRTERIERLERVEQPERLERN